MKKDEVYENGGTYWSQLMLVAELLVLKVSRGNHIQGSYLRCGGCALLCAVGV